MYLTFVSTEVERKWLEKCCLGMLCCNFSWEDNGEELQSECGNQIKVCHLGDNDILIQNLSPYSQEELKKEIKE